jgi:uncharacterized protein (DUF362 family)
MMRRFAIGGLLAAGAAVATRAISAPSVPKRSREQSRVAVLACAGYEAAPRTVEDGLRLIGAKVSGKSVLLKPNLVEYAPSACINTHPMVVGSTIEALYRMGAASVVVAEGPGHVRDTELLLEECGLGDMLHSVGKARFLDLNFDEVTSSKPATSLTNLDCLWLPRAICEADVIISMPKVKTHHWAGVTLSLKNLFGVLPGSVYGWPKNVLHWEGIDNSIVELAASVPVHYVIADGIDAMEGNGPLHGPSRHLGALVFADDPVAADATCCRLMGIDPTKVPHLSLAAPLGNLEAARISQLGESVEKRCQDFVLMKEFSYLRTAPAAA